MSAVTFVPGPTAVREVFSARFLKQPRSAVGGACENSFSFALRGSQARLMAIIAADGIAHDQHADHQLRVNRRTPNWALKIGEVMAQVAGPRSDTCQIGVSPLRHFRSRRPGTDAVDARHRRALRRGRSVRRTTEHSWRRALPGLAAQALQRQPGAGVGRLQRNPTSPSCSP
jgi:hypothetical protein